MNRSEHETPPPRSSIWQDAAWVLPLFAASRLLVIMIVLLSRQMIERGPYVAVSVQNEHGGTLLDIFTQWDGNWYRLIAQNGYAPPMPAVATAFFPVYPFLVRGVAFVVRDLQVASVLVSNGCLIAAALLLVRLLRLDYDEPVCRRAIIFLLFNPVSFFLSAAYSESTFLLFSVAALFAARRGKWSLAGILGGCLSATRSPGLLIGVPLLAEHIGHWRSAGRDWHRLFRPHLLWLGLIPLGLGVWMLVCHLQRGDSLLPMHALDAGWKKKLTLPWETFLWPTHFTPSYIRLYQTMAGAAIVLTAAGAFLRLRAPYLLYAVVSVLFYLSWGSLDGLPRYVSILFPIHVVTALVSLRWKWTYEPLLAFSIGLLALCTVLFANAYQIT